MGYSVPESVAIPDTLETILTSIELFICEEASVVTPVIIPLRKPVKDVVVPAPGVLTEVSWTVTPNPTVAPAPTGLVVVIPIVWSAKLSIVHTFRFVFTSPASLEA